MAISTAWGLTAALLGLVPRPNSDILLVEDGLPASEM